MRLLTAWLKPRPFKTDLRNSCCKRGTVGAVPFRNRYHTGSSYQLL